MLFDVAVGSGIVFLLVDPEVVQIVRNEYWKELCEYLGLTSAES
jgi:hypothetical protein